MLRIAITLNNYGRICNWYSFIFLFDHYGMREVISKYSTAFLKFLGLTAFNDIDQFSVRFVPVVTEVPCKRTWKFTTTSILDAEAQSTWPCQ